VLVRAILLPAASQFWLPLQQTGKCFTNSAPASSERENASQILRMPGKSCGCLANSSAASISRGIALAGWPIDERAAVRFDVRCRKLGSWPSQALLEAAMMAFQSRRRSVTVVMRRCGDLTAGPKDVMSALADA
jgi:hypothetical protein